MNLKVFGWQMFTVGVTFMIVFPRVHMDPVHHHQSLPVSIGTI